MEETDDKKIVLYPKTYGTKNEEVKWVETKTCFISTAPQGSELWHSLRIGIVSSSRVTGYNGNSKFVSTDPKENALSCLGLKRKEFDKDSLIRMKRGLDGEPTLRDFYSRHIKQKIDEVGIAVWKEDPRFRASLDGIYNEGKCGVEFKITKRIYRPLLEYIEKKDKTTYSHLWRSHYEQMVQSMEVLGLESIDYVVWGYDNNKVYIEKIYPNPEYFREEMYKPSCLFLDNFVQPLMREKDIQRIDPYPLDSEIRG